MPRYRNEFGVVVNIPAEKAARINGLTPVDAGPPPGTTEHDHTEATPPAPNVTDPPAPDDAGTPPNVTDPPAPPAAKTGKAK